MDVLQNSEQVTVANMYAFLLSISYQLLMLDKHFNYYTFIHIYYFSLNERQNFWMINKSQFNHAYKDTVQSRCFAHEKSCLPCVSYVSESVSG